MGCLGRPICWLGFVPPALLASSFIFPDLLSPVPSARGGDFFRALQLQESNRIEIEFKAKARTGWLGFCGVPKSDGVQNRILAISRRDPPGKEGGIVVCFSCHVAAGVAAAHPPLRRDRRRHRRRNRPLSEPSSLSALAGISSPTRAGFFAS